MQVISSGNVRIGLAGPKTLAANPLQEGYVGFGHAASYVSTTGNGAKLPFLNALTLQSLRWVPCSNLFPCGIIAPGPSWTRRAMRAVIYARYSSEHQSEHSIDDQVRSCRARAEREGRAVTEVYADYALSGASTNRPRLQALLAAARQNPFKVVLAKARNRICRDQEHTAGIWKGLSFTRIKLVTLAEGEISELHVGLQGTMNALFLKDLAAKTLRPCRACRGRQVRRRHLLRL